MLRKQGNIARIESLSLVEVDLALLPLTSPARDIGQRFRNLAAVRKESPCLFKVMHGCVVIFQAGVVVISLGQYRLAEIGLESQRRFSSPARLLPELDCWLKSECEIAERINVRKQRPGQSEFGIQPDGF